MGGAKAAKVKVRREAYKFKAKDAKNKLHQGRVTAPNLADARQALNVRGYNIQSIAKEKSLLDSFKNFGSVGAKDRSIFYREVSTMLKAGLSITQSIDIATETPNKKLKSVLREVYLSLENGFPLSVAMSGYPKVFPMVEVGVVRAGEATGSLSKVLMELSHSTSRSAEFSKRVKSAMTYPAFILIVLVVVGSIILVKVIPPLKDIFTQTGTELPVATKILLAVTDFLVNDWAWLIGIFIALAGLLKFALSTKAGKRWGSVMSLNFPAFGELVRQVFLAQFSRTLSLLVSSGVPIIEAVAIIKESSNNVIYAEILEKLSKALEQGSSISTVLSQTKYFPKLVSQLLFVGQQAGDLGGVSSVLAEYFEDEVDNKLRTLSALIEPFIIVIIGIAVAFVIVSVLQPIYSLTGAF